MTNLNQVGNLPLYELLTLLAKYSKILLVGLIPSLLSFLVSKSQDALLALIFMRFIFLSAMKYCYILIQLTNTLMLLNNSFWTSNSFATYNYQFPHISFSMKASLAMICAIIPSLFMCGIYQESAIIPSLFMCEIYQEIPISHSRNVKFTKFKRQENHSL